MRSSFSAPRGLKATPQAGGAVKLEWDGFPTDAAAALVTDYVIERSTDNVNWITVDDGVSSVTVDDGIRSVASTSVTGLVGGQTHWFRVRSAGATFLGEPATIGPVTTLASKPSAPTGLTAESGNGQATLRWQAPTATGGSPITGYLLRWSSDAGVTWTTATTSGTITGSPPSATVTGLVNGVAYTFSVAALNAAGTGDAVVTSGATTPVAPSTSLGATIISQTFNAMTASATSALPTGFAIASGSSPTWTAATQTATTAFAGTTGTGALTGSSAGGTYLFVNGDRATGTDKAIGFLTSSTYVGPRSILLRVTNGAGTLKSVNVAWDYVKYRSGTTPTEWKFYASPDGVNWTAVTAGNKSYPADATNTAVGLSTTAVDFLMLPGFSVAGFGNYFLRWDYAGVGSHANTQALGIDNVRWSFVTANTPPGPPIDLVATPAAGAVQLSWKQPLADGGLPVTDYAIEYASQATGVWQSYTDGTDAVAPASKTPAGSVTVGGLDPFVPYLFRVAAVNSLGRGAWLTTATSASPTATQPPAPSVGNVTPGDAQATVRWTTAGDGGAAVSAFAIEQSTDAGVSWRAATVSGTLTGSSRSATVTGLTNGYAYTFRVRATNSVGTGAFSTASQPVTPKKTIAVEWALDDTASQWTASPASLTRTYSVTGPSRGEFTAGIRVAGDATTQQFVTIFVNPVAPSFNTVTPDPTADQTATEGTARTIQLGSFTGPAGDGTANNNTEWQVDVRWWTGDTVDPSHAASFTAPRDTSMSRSITFPRAGTWTVKVTVTDNDGQPVARTFEVDVTPAPQTADIGRLVGGTFQSLPGPVAIRETESLDLVGQVTKTGVAAVSPRQYEWVVTKDGAAFDKGDAATFTLQPDDGGTYVVRFRAQDENATSAGDFWSGWDSLTVTVGHVAPTAAMTIQSPTREGDIATESVPQGTPLLFSATATAAKPAVDTIESFAWTIARVGGGQPTTGAGETFSFTPSVAGDYRITLAATDSDGQTTTTSARLVTVTNLAPTIVGTITGLPPAPIAEGTPIALTVTASDFGDTSALTYAWKVARNGLPYDPTVDDPTIATNQPAFEFTPRDDGEYAVKVIVSDGSETATANGSFTVVNVAPTATITARDADDVVTTAVDQGGFLTFTVTATDVAADAASLRYAFDLDDDGTWEVEGSPLATYETEPLAQAGFRRLRARVTDKDGGETSQTIGFAVNNVAPAIDSLEEQTTVTTETVSRSAAFARLAVTARTPVVAAATVGRVYARNGGISLQGTFSDLGRDTQAYRGTATIISRADQSKAVIPLLVSQDGRFNLSHAFARTGVYDVTTSITDGLTGTPATRSIEVESLPTVVGVTTPNAAGVLRIGDTLAIAVRFSGPVIVDGAPTLALLVGVNGAASPRLAVATGSTTPSDTVIFRYTIVAGDVDADGVEAPGPVGFPAGAAIRTPDGTVLSLDFQGLPLPVITVRNELPTAVPTNVAGTPGDGRVALSWTAPVAFPATVTGYKVEYSGDNGGTWTEFPTAATTPPATTATVTGLTNGAAYVFRVTALGAGVTGGVSSTSAAVTPRTLPAAPGAVTGTAGDRRVILSWSAPDSDGGAVVTDYRVEFSRDGSNWTTFADGTSTKTSAIVTGLGNGLAYVFRVSAVNAAGPGPASAPSAAVTPRTLPTRPNSVAATPADRSVSISWTAPLRNGGSPITSYTIEYSGDGGATWRQWGSAAVPPTPRSATITGLDNGTAYLFRIYANTVVGSSALPVVSAATTPRTVPSAPIDVTGVPSGESVALSWTAPASTGGAAITNYQVEYSGDAGVSWTTFNYAPASPPATSVVVTGLLPARPYVFRVTAVNVAGAGLPAVSPTVTTLGNRAPTAIALSATAVAENLPVGTVVGTLSTVDPDLGDTFRYTLVPDATLDGTGLFEIVGDQLRTKAAFNFEAKSSYSIRVRSTDQGGLFVGRVFTITVTNVNEAPTAIVLSATTVAENLPAGTVVGTLSTVDPDVGNTFRYAIVPDATLDGTGLFEIVGNQLRTKAAFNFEAKSSYSIRVRSTDQGGLFVGRVFTITVTNVNEAPTALLLSATTVLENQPVGTVVGTLSTVDPDAGDTFRYLLVPDLALDGTGQFEIVGNQVRTKAVFNAATKSSYSIRVRSVDRGGLLVARVFTITVGRNA